jgi:hypothetical protein
MKLYSVKVHLDGNRNNEVRKPEVTAAEIAVLQRLHGSDAVLDIAEIGHVNGRTDRRERARLADIYKRGPSADRKQMLDGPAFIDSIFGAAAPLPPAYEPPVEFEAEEVVIEQEAKETIVKAEKAKPIKVKTVVPASARTSPVKREEAGAELPA